LYFQDQITNAYAFLLINRSLNKDKELNLTTNHRSPRAKRFANYALKTGMEGVQNLFNIKFSRRNMRYDIVSTYDSTQRERIFSGRYGVRTLSLSLDLGSQRCCMLTGGPSSMYRPIHS
jgi:hypothetical protein